MSAVTNKRMVSCLMHNKLWDQKVTVVSHKLVTRLKYNCNKSLMI